MKVLATLFATLALVACGGGGGADGPTPVTGQFTDSPVQGLQYRSASQSGETNANGEFRYVPGETVTFFVGDITLGTALGAAKVTPFNLAGTTPPATVPASGLTAVAFDQAINLAVFLQTLDTDSNPDNGIAIPAAMRTLTNGVAIDFQQARDVFPTSLALRQLVGAGRTAGLWDATHAIRTPTLAIKSMYASLGLVPVVPAVMTVKTLDLSDPAHTQMLYRETITRDAAGNATQTVWEYNNGGVLERWVDTAVFDAQGHPTHTQSDSNGDGRTDQWTTTTFNIDGDLTVFESLNDSNRDGVGDYRSITRWTYDARGLVTEIRHEFDSGDDGSIDETQIDTYSHDTQGRLTQNTLSVDGVVRYLMQITYDAQGREIQRVVDQDTDSNGDLNQRIIYTFNASHLGGVYEEDRNGDGTVDVRMTDIFDAAGHRLSSAIDNNADGTVDMRRTFAYDANGRRIRSEWDNNADGVVDVREVSTFTADGYLTLVERDTDGNGTVNQQTVITYSN